MSGFDPFAPSNPPPQQRTNSFDPFGASPTTNNGFSNSSNPPPSQSPSQPSSSTGFGDFNEMASALPSHQHSNNFGNDDGFFAAEFNDTPKQSVSPQSGTTNSKKPGFSSQTSTEFDSIFGATAIDPGQKQQQGGGSPQKQVRGSAGRWGREPDVIPPPTTTNVVSFSPSFFLRWTVAKKIRLSMISSILHLPNPPSSSQSASP